MWIGTVFCGSNLKYSLIEKCWRNYGVVTLQTIEYYVASENIDIHEILLRGKWMQEKYYFA